MNSTFIRHRMNEAGGLLCLLLAAYLCLSLTTFNAADPSFNNATPTHIVYNAGGRIGAYLSDWLLTTFGLASFAPAFVLAAYGGFLISHRTLTHTNIRLATVPLLVVALSAFMAILAPIPGWPEGMDAGITNGGLVGKLVAKGLFMWVGAYLAIALSFSISLLAVLWLSGLTLADLYHFSMHIRTVLALLMQISWRLIRRIQFRKATQFDLPLANAVRKKKTQIKVEVESQKSAPSSNRRAEKEKQTSLPLNLGEGYALPPLNLLDQISGEVVKESEEALTQNARQIEAQLRNFGVSGEVKKVRPGPVITIYELEPAPGVKTSSVVNLSDDLARAMSATAIRIAPIPGRNVIGIEMPNFKRRSVSLRELLAHDEFETHPGKLSVALGVDTGGKPTYADISKMPHALIAGTTGSGKSVAMNAFILSLLYRMSPQQLRFVMIDPKMLELSIYNDIPHLLTPVITDPNKAAAALKWVVGEMEKRYKLMSELGVKNIQSFNTRFLEMKEQGEIPTRLVQTGFDPATGQPRMEKQPLAEESLPYIVVVIDELADLMMVAGKQVEVYIARLAQMARAAGIHLLVATQRPSVDVVTGLIKANIPTRISFNVTSKIDSRTVLDQMGAEQLLGRGDMLYMANGENALVRLHGAFVSEDECTKVADHLKQQSDACYVEDIFATGSTPGEGGATSDVEDNDPLYLQAIEIVAKEQKASTSFIQRHLKIGYNRAATLVDKMEADGLIGPADHVGKRDVIMKKPPEGGY